MNMNATIGMERLGVRRFDCPSSLQVGVSPNHARPKQEWQGPLRAPAGARQLQQTGDDNSGGGTPRLDAR
jgi:hypothetical protein